jgi:predicted  nucleic acid-binding Zn-ribbon protein
MDKQTLGVLIPVLAVFFCGLIALSRTAIGKALARRIGGEENVPAALEGELRELRSELDALRGELMETQERLDFTERQLAAGKREG